MTDHALLRIRTAVLTLALLAGVAPGASAQTGAGVFVAIPDAFPDIDAPSIVVRDGGRDVILLRQADASVETLAMSLRVLARARTRTPSSTHGEMIPLVGYALSHELAEEVRDRLERVLSRLARGPVRDMGALGPGRWVPYEPRR